MLRPGQGAGDRRSQGPQPRGPLRRKPKRLDEEPTLFDASPGAGGGPVQPGERGGRVTGGSRRPRQVTRSGTTGDRGVVLAEVPGGGEVDAETLRWARRIAARLSVPRPRRDLTARRGVGELASVPYRGGSDDIDLDPTIERLVEHPLPDEDDIVVRERMRTKRSVVLLADVSGSMRGERARTAAATVGALAAELARDDRQVVAFWSNAAILCHLGDRAAPRRLLEQLLRIPASGLTNIAFPLQVAARELARVPVRDARALLLSDCVHNAGPDPRRLAARLPRLDVLLDTTGEQDPDLAADLASVGRGRLRRVGGYRDVAPALGDIFAG